MNVRMLCLGVLSYGDSSGYGIRKTVQDSFGHFAQASLGAIYPALAKAQARGEIEAVGATDAPLEKRVFRLTETGRMALTASIEATDGMETLRSPFLAAMFFAHFLTMDDIHRLMDDRLAGLRREQRRLRGLPIAEMTEGQRFTIRYALASTGTLIAFLEQEGRAIVAAMGRERIN